MQNYIIISIIIAIIIFFLYIKKSNKEHFDISTINLESIKNIYSTFVNPQDTVSFNNIIAKNINTEELNKNIVVDIDLSSNITHGDILKYDSSKKVWENSKTVFPQYVYLNIYKTLGIIQGQHMDNLLGRTQDTDNIADLKYFPLDKTMDICSNEFYSYYGPYNSITNKYGLRYEELGRKIFGFDPAKTYKLDCSLMLYGMLNNSNWTKCSLVVSTVFGKVLLKPYVSAYADGMTQVINIKTILKNIPYEGIQFFFTTKETGNDNLLVNFWGSTATQGRYNTTFTLYIQEITDVL